MSAGPVVLDASALIAFLRGERGGEPVEPLLPEAVISAVNWSEILQVLAEFDVSHEQVRAALPMVEVVAFSEPQAAVTADLRERTRSFGLSFADRACLSLAMLRDGVVYTADRAWADLDLGVEIRLIR